MCGVTKLLGDFVCNTLITLYYGYHRAAFIPQVQAAILNLPYPYIESTIVLSDTVFIPINATVFILFKSVVGGSIIGGWCLIIQGGLGTFVTCHNLSTHSRTCIVNAPLNRNMKSWLRELTPCVLEHCDIAYIY